ncbi:MAG: DEAD/DEAH box helicase, partial [Cetobacterium sp.]
MIKLKIIRNKDLLIIPKGDYEAKVILDLLKKDCIKENPKYEKMMKSGRFQKGVEKEIITFTFNKKENVFKIYKANYEVYKKLLDLKLPLEEEKDERVSFPVDITCSIGPRDTEQEKVIKAVKEFYNGFGYGLIEASPSAGKTAMACMMMGHVKQRTLVLVDMNLLVEQFVESILAFTNVKKEEIGFIRGNELDYGLDKKIIIATNQSLAKKPEILKELENNIGFVIQDEAQIASCDTVQKVFGELRPKYQLGLSGTPYRDDKMDFLIREAIGPIMCKANRQAMVENGSMITPILRPLFIYDKEKLNDRKYANAEFREVVDDFYNCPKAIDRITNLVMHHYRQDDSQLLICKEKTMIVSYYRTLINKICGVDFLIEAEREKIKEDYKKELEYDAMVIAEY